ncbi:Polymer-forming cytoskeletal [compost metagenome]
MFGRKSNSVAAAPSKVTVIAAGACFRGDLQVEGDLEVRGQLVGTIQLVDGVLRIMQGGSVEGEVNAPHVTINGLLDGTCSAVEVEILENGKMQGIFKGGCLSICKGGNFIGHSHPGEVEGTGTVPISVSINQERRGSQVKEKRNVSPLPKESNDNENAQLAKQA